MSISRVELVHLNKTKEIALGSPLLDLEPLLRFGCRAGACGSCAIRIFDGAENLSAMKEKEKKGLERMRFIEKGIRLACQATISGDCKIGPVSLTGGDHGK